MVQLVSDNIQNATARLNRFLGDDLVIVNREQDAISNVITAEWVEVSLPEENQPEETGILFLYPIDEAKFCLELMFLQYPDNAGDNALVCNLRFLPPFFDQYPPDALMANQPFRFDRSTEQLFPVCSQARILIAQLKNESEMVPFIRSLKQTETSLHLLRRALECLTIPYNICQVPACRFLAFETEREKIKEARQILEANFSQPPTIRELARKVAINECYLKKGFKALVGKTIHEYQQELRITKAKELLQQQGQSVTEVADILGYSSISHFSTAFKRITGLKPCELLS